MADKKLSQVIGGNGGFLPKFASGMINVPPGATGTYITLTPPAGQRVRLTGFGAQTLQTNLTTISIGGNPVATDVLIEATSGNVNGINEFLIGWGNAVHPYLDGDTDQAMEISTNVATSSAINYTYEFGE